MPSLYDAVLVLTAAVNPPPVSGVDFEVLQLAGGQPRITLWNAARLGAQPTPDQLAAVTQQQVDDYRDTQVVAGTAALAAVANPINGGVRLGDIYTGQHHNHLIQWINATLLPALQAAGINLAAYAPPTDVTQVDPAPLTVDDAKQQAANVLTKQPGWLTQ